MVVPRRSGGFDVERLKNPQEFSAVYTQGRPHFGKYVVVSILPTDRSVTRVGFAVGKKVGNAVTRNKVKRRLRAIMQGLEKKLCPGMDVIIGAKRNSVTASFRDLEDDLCRVLKHSGVLTQKSKSLFKVGRRSNSSRAGEEHA